jgi:DNA-binding beta-propeller fold protein YncE
MFLYGPNDYGKLAVRNPQGMALLGNVLLVADQGLPDLVAIDLATGRSLPFTHPDHRPYCPVDVATDGQRVYVADAKAGRVIVYDPHGQRLEELAPPGAQPLPVGGPASSTGGRASRPPSGSPETPPSPAAHPFRPVSVLTSANILYIGNVAGHNVERFDLTTRQWLDPLAPPADAKPLAAPTGLDMLPDGTLLIVDAVQGHVLRYTRDGQWLAPLGRPGRRAGEFVRPKHVAHTPSGLILITDAGRQSVLVFDADGRHLMELHETDTHWRGFTLPTGVLALPPASLAPVFNQRNTPPPADEYLLVSDELGAPGLTLVGFITHPRPEVPDAH